MRIFLTLLLVFLSTFTQGQIKTRLSPSIDIPELGWNKTVMMRNGNTLLFHFQYHRKVTVKVFDSSRKEVATYRHMFKVADVNILEESYFDGLYDINGEAVLFITQHYNNKQTLIRLRFDSNNGRLISEDVVVQSRSLVKETSAWVAMEPDSDNYYVVSLVDDINHRTEKIILEYFNNKHERLKSMPYEIDKYTYHKVFLKDWCFSHDGHLLFSIKLLKEGSFNEKINYSYLGLLYLPKGYDKIVGKIIELPKEMVLIRARITNNSFSRLWNVLVSYLWDPLNSKYLAAPNQLMLIYNENFKLLKQVELGYNKINEELGKITNSNQSFIGGVETFSTSEYGITNIIKSSGRVKDTGRYFVRGNELYVTSEYGVTTIGDANYLVDRKKDDNILYTGLTSFNDRGEEVGAVIIVKPNFNSYIYRHAYDLSGPVFYHKTIVRDATTHFVIENKGNYSLLYNDRNVNFNLDASSGKNFEIMSFDSTNAMCVTINRKRQVKKEYVFKPMLPNVYTTLLGGADYDIRKKMYSGVVRRITDTSRTLHLAWIEF